ncbi:MAG: hypothetical protein GY820_39695 [Gammaproteobacteria bacterium]|nr:hypothetical protein [Gammaproteobacteria bacterium]
MPLIYEPKGKAREYSPLALNIYTDGCDHGCTYCYCANMAKAFGRPWTAKPRPRDLTGLANEAAKAKRQILLCFVGDPYCGAEREWQRTREALEILFGAKCSVAILTKGGSRCLRDIWVFRHWPDCRIKVGATLTFADSQKSCDFEPGATCPEERLDTLEMLHRQGVKTWASIEPVIESAESLAVIEASLPFTDQYKVGKLNHAKTNIDWRNFATRAVRMIRAGGRELYVKADLRAYLPSGFLTPEECDLETLTLPDRPENTGG